MAFCSKNNQLIGRGTRWLRVMEDIKKAARYDYTVLLIGETGTGKSLMAGYIHDNGPRKGKTFVTIDLALITDTLAEAQLFGHTRGAFTDAKTEKIGLFKEADGGTVFLDEITNASPALQAKLLRVLQEMKIRKLGGTEDETVDVRILVATNRDIRELVQKGIFRTDLYYRLKSVVIEVPPLRERKDDFEVLIQKFLKDRKAPDGSIKSIEPDAVGFLREHPDKWPGNVRELESTIERLIALSEGDIITLKDVRNIIGRKSYVLKRSPEGQSYGDNLKRTVNEFKKAHIIQILRENNSNRKNTARQLGISNRQLTRLIKGLEISKNACQ